VDDGGHWAGTLTGIAVLAACALPVAVLAVWALARRRRRGGAEPGWAWRASLAEIGIPWWTVPLVWMTMVPGGRAGTVAGEVSPVPLQDLLVDSPLQIVGNLGLFAAVGALAPLRFAALASLPRILALGATASTTIEVLQYVLELDRVSSVDDVLLNTVGAGLAALATRRWWRVGPGTARPPGSPGRPPGPGRPRRAARPGPR
jgi:hypothetical protein